MSPWCKRLHARSNHWGGEVCDVVISGTRACDVVISGTRAVVTSVSSEGNLLTREVLAQARTTEMCKRPVVQGVVSRQTEGDLL